MEEATTLWITMKSFASDNSMHIIHKAMCMWDCMCVSVFFCLCVYTHLCVCVCDCVSVYANECACVCLTPVDSCRRYSYMFLITYLWNVLNIHNLHHYLENEK